MLHTAQVHMLSDILLWVWVCLSTPKRVAGRTKLGSALLFSMFINIVNIDNYIPVFNLTYLNIMDITKARDIFAEIFRDCINVA